MSITNNNAVAKVAAAVAGAGLVLSSFAFVAPAQADTTSDLQAQINALLAQIASLQGQLGGSSSSMAQFTRDLTIGSTGADVTELQTWLISKGYSIPAGATGYFGVQTQAAVAAFQAANGITPAAGYFGPITRAKVNAMLSAGGTTGGGTTGGTTLSGGEATLSNYNLTTGDTVAEGDTGVELATAKFDVKGGDINVGRVRVEVQEASNVTASNDPWLYFDRLYVYDGTTKVGSVDVSSRDAWDDNSGDNTHSGSGDVYSIDIPTSDVVKDGDTAMLTVKADAQNTIDSDNEDQVFKLDIPDQGIRAVDAAGIQEYEGDTGDTVSVDFNGATAGKLTVSEDSDDPDAGVLVADDNQSTDGLTVFKFDLKNTQDGDSLIDSIDMSVATTTATGGAKDITSILRRATLTLDGHDYDGDINTDNTITFNLNNDNVIVKGNDSTTGTVTVDLASQSGHYAATGESLTFSIDGSSQVTAEGEQNGKTTTVTGTANGNKQSIALNGGISVAGNSMSTNLTYNSQNPASSYGTFTLKFDVTAVGDDVYVPRSISSTTAASTTVGVVVNEDLGAAVGVGTTSASLTSTADSDNAYYYVIHAGDTETFTATVTIDPATTGDYQVGLDDVRFSTVDTYASLSSLQTLDIDQNDSQFHTDPLHIPNS